MTTFAVTIPHAAHRPERKESLDALIKSLLPALDQHAFRVFQDKEPHWQWSLKMWKYALEADRDYLVQLQDDVTVPENFFDVLQAMTEHRKPDVIALIGVHPVAREIARMGGRWHRSRAWLMGNGYMLSRRFLQAFVPWREANEDQARYICEDALINKYAMENGIDVWHPLPSPVVHNLALPTTWGEQAKGMGIDTPDAHGHRQAVVSWQDFNVKELARADFWHQPGAAVRLLPNNIAPQCWFCLEEPAFISSSETGVHVGPNCFAKMAHVAGSRMVGQHAGPR